MKKFRVTFADGSYVIVEARSQWEAKNKAKAMGKTVPIIAEEVKSNPKRNPPSGAVKIYDDIEAIEAVKGGSSLWPGEKFRHDFKKTKGRASVYGLPDGSILIKGKKRLWKNFNYSKNDI